MDHLIRLRDRASAGPTTETASFGGNWRVEPHGARQMGFRTTRVTICCFHKGRVEM